MIIHEPCVEVMYLVNASAANSTLRRTWATFLAIEVVLQVAEVPFGGRTD